MTITEKLTLTHPFIQAPLACYPDQAPLVSAVSEAGGLGVLSADMQYLNDIGHAINAVRERTDKPFAVQINLTDSETGIDLADRSSTNTYLKPAYKTLNIEAQEAPALPDVNAVCKAVAEQKPPVLIFQNGVPSDEFIEHCRRSGMVTLAVAANTLEAIAIQHTRIDGIILQGAQTAGLQSQFDNDLPDAHFPIMALLHHAKQHTRKPLIVWGDCQTPETVAFLLTQGAVAAVLDTPLWTCKESSIPDAYRQALHTHNETRVTASCVWQGQPANTLANALTEQQRQGNGQTLAARKQQRLILPVIEAAIAQNNADYLPLWAGLCAITANGSAAEVCQYYAAALKTPS